MIHFGSLKKLGTIEIPRCKVKIFNTYTNEITVPDELYERELGFRNDIARESRREVGEEVLRIIEEHPDKDFIVKINRVNRRDDFRQHRNIICRTEAVILEVET